MSRFGEEEDWQRQARAKAQQAEEEFRRQEAIEAALERKRRLAQRKVKGGEWRFSPLTNERGDVVGYDVVFNQRKAAVVMIVRDDLVVFTSADEHDEASPSYTDVMAAFMEFGPGAER